MSSGVIVDHYAGAGPRWAAGAALVYGPIAREIVAMAPRGLAGRSILDAGAGTGLASQVLTDCGARPVAADYSVDMLGWRADERPPAVVADLCALPLADRAVDDTVSAFVLNHLIEPGAGFAELIRVTRPGGALLAAVFSTASRSDARDQADEVAIREGWRVPEWYVDLKTRAVPVLGTAEDMRRAAQSAGLDDIKVDERAADVGVTEPEQLVEYRFSQAHFTEWLAELGPARTEDLKRRAADAIRPAMQPFRPIVVFLSATVTG